MSNTYLKVGGGNISDTSVGTSAQQDVALANNQVSAANVTGFLLPTTTVRGFEAIVTAHIDATTDLNEVFEVKGIQLAADWVISVESTGDNSGVTLSITSAGQLQYTSGNYSGFSSATLSYKITKITV